MNTDLELATLVIIFFISDKILSFVTCNTQRMINIRNKTKSSSLRH